MASNQNFEVIVISDNDEMIPISDDEIIIDNERYKNSNLI